MTFTTSPGACASTSVSSSSTFLTRLPSIADDHVGRLGVEPAVERRRRSGRPSSGSAGSPRGSAGPPSVDAEDEQALVRGEDPGDAQVGADDPAVLDQRA